MPVLTDQQLADTEKQLRDAAQQKGVTYDPSDLQGIVTHVGYNEGGSSLDQALQSTLDRYDIRSSDVPGHGPDSSDSSGISHSAGSGTRSTSGSGGSGGSSGSRGAPPAAPPVSPQQLDDLLALVKSMNNSPTGDPSSITVGDLPTITVPGQDLGPDIDRTLIDTMRGTNSDPLDIQSYLKNYLARTKGGASGNSPQYAQAVEQAREALTKGEIAAKNDLGGTLADRGLIGSPGHPEGAELDSTVRAFEPLQRTYLDTLRGATVDEGNRADTAERDALQRATGWSSEQVNQKLAAAGSAGERQAMLSDIALKTLAQNADWNKFLANFGLDREKAEAAIQQGKMDAIGPIIQMFLALAANTQRGFI